MVPREKQLCISAMLVVLNALTSILYTTVKKKHVHCKNDWFIDQVNNALNNNEKNYQWYVLPMVCFFSVYF